MRMFSHLVVNIDEKNMFHVFYKSVKTCFLMFFYFDFNVFFCAFECHVFVLVKNQKRTKLQI